MGVFADNVPWVTMMILHKVDDTLVFHTHAVFGLLATLHPSALSTHMSH
jgi:hypothetical protein